MGPHSKSSFRRGRRCLKIEWHDRAWRPRLVVRFGERQDPDWRVSVLDCGGKRSATLL